MSDRSAPTPVPSNNQVVPKGGAPAVGKVKGKKTTPTSSDISQAAKKGQEEPHSDRDGSVYTYEENTMEMNVITYNPCFCLRCFNLRTWSLVIAGFLVLQSAIHMAELAESPSQEKCEQQVDALCLVNNVLDFKDCKEAAVMTCDELITWHDAAVCTFCILSLICGGLLFAAIFGRIWVVAVVSATLLCFATLFYWIVVGLQYKLAKAINAYGGGNKDQAVQAVKGAVATVLQLLLVVCIVGFATQLRAKADHIPPEENTKFFQRYFLTKWGLQKVDDDGTVAPSASTASSTHKSQPPVELKSDSVTTVT